MHAETIARTLRDKHSVQVWLKNWTKVPGLPLKEELVRALGESASCAVCFGKKTPVKWFKEEMNEALAVREKRKGFRVIPVLLPYATREVIRYLENKRLDFADFRQKKNHDFAFHILCCGIRNEKPGDWALQSKPASVSTYENKLRELKQQTSREKGVIEVQRFVMEELSKDKE